MQPLGGMDHSAETDMQRYSRDHPILGMTPITNEMAHNAIVGSLGLPGSF